MRDAYGRTGVGQGMLLARRLIEVRSAAGDGISRRLRYPSDHEKSTKPLMADFDEAFPVLLEDLEQRGLLQTTLVLVIGDFGRTPKINFSAAVITGLAHFPSPWPAQEFQAAL